MPSPKPSPIEGGFTLRKMGAIIKADQSMVSRIINGKRLPSVPVVERIAKEFGISLATLVSARNAGPEEFAALMKKRVVDPANAKAEKAAAKASA